MPTVAIMVKIKLANCVCHTCFMSALNSTVSKLLKQSFSKEMEDIFEQINDTRENIPSKETKAQEKRSSQKISIIFRTRGMTPPLCLGELTLQ